MSNQIFPDSLGNEIALTPLNDDFSIEEFDIWNLEATNPAPGPNSQESSLFKVFPNPLTGNSFWIVKIKDGFAGKLSFKLYNASGMFISEFRPAGSYLIIPANKIAPGNGVYFLSGSDGVATQTEKLLVLQN